MRGRARWTSARRRIAAQPETTSTAARPAATRAITCAATTGGVAARGAARPARAAAGAAHAAAPAWAAAAPGALPCRLVLRPVSRPRLRPRPAARWVPLRWRVGIGRAPHDAGRSGVKWLRRARTGTTRPIGTFRTIGGSARAETKRGCITACLTARGTLTCAEWGHPDQKPSGPLGGRWLLGRKRYVRFSRRSHRAVISKPSARK